MILLLPIIISKKIAKFNRILLHCLNISTQFRHDETNFNEWRAYDGILPFDQLIFFKNHMRLIGLDIDF